MATPTRFCQQCGKPVGASSVFCNSCGARQLPEPTVAVPASQPPTYHQPGPAPAYSAAQPPSVNYASPPPKRSGMSLLLIGLLSGGGVCLCAALVALALGVGPIQGFLSDLPGFQEEAAAVVEESTEAPTASKKNITVTPSNTQPPTTLPQPPTALPLPTSTFLPEPTRTSMPALPLPPTATAPLQPPASGGETVFTDDFSNPNSGWEVTKQGDYELSYTGDSSYFIGVKSPQSTVIVTPPYHFDQPVKNVAVTFLGKTFSSGSSVFGAVCNYTSKNSYYWVGVSVDQYAIGKMVNGQFTYLTDPHWKNLNGASLSDHGFLEVGFSCFDGFLVFEAGGMGQEHLVDTDLSSGDVGLFVESTKDRDGPLYYTQAFFKDFKAELVK